jgi:hypothetical protein
MIYNFINRHKIIKDGKTITHVLLSPKQVHDDQIKLRRESEAKESENLSKKHGERRNLNSSTNQNLMNLVESGIKKRKEKKISV